jgi:hypothetical protein
MDDDWDALNGASETLAGGVNADADPFGGDDDMFGGGGTSAPAPAASNGMDDDMFGGSANGGLDDMFGGSSLLTPAPAAAAAAAAPDMDDMFAPNSVPAPMPAAAAPVAFGNATPHEDNSLIEEWERKKRAQLQQRREESTKKTTVAKEAGNKALQEFEAKRKGDVQKAQTKNRTEEKATVQDMEAALKAGLVGKESWEKVTTYLDLSSDPKRNNTISRMKSVLIAIKSSPPAEKRNFGA